MFLDQFQADGEVIKDLVIVQNSLEIVYLVLSPKPNITYDLINIGKIVFRSQLDLIIGSTSSYLPCLS